jgi:glycosyltransferase involved in cell wall biosynthesis
MIILIGNFLSGKGLNPTAIEDLADTLSSKYKVLSASSKQNPVLRLWEIVFILLKNKKKCQLVIVDIFSTHAFWFSFFSIIICKLYKIKYIPVFRGGNLGEKYKKVPRLFHFLFKSSVINICPSKFFFEEFNNTPFTNKLIPNYIKLDNYSYKNRSEIKPKLLWVRSIHSIYNPLMAIKVLSILSEKYPDAFLCMVGPIKEKEVHTRLMRKIQSTKLEGKIKFTGQLFKEDWIQLSQEYDIFLNTTNIDNTPVSVMEAMALGLPVISTNVGGIPNLITHGENGFLVDADDEKEMANQILELLQSEEKVKSVVKNAHDFISQFDKNIIINKWYEVIDETLYS